MTTINREQVRRYSIGVAQAMISSEGLLVASAGEGDARLIWLRVDGREVIATNGDPVWEDSDPEGFEQLREAFPV